MSWVKPSPATLLATSKTSGACSVPFTISGAVTRDWIPFHHPLTPAP